SVCEGDNYTLPSGSVVSNAGIYQDTIKYFSSGCDSLIYTIDVKINPLTRSNLSVALCAGEKYFLPSGKEVTSAGLYSDTLKNISGCDSLITLADISLRTLF